MSVPDSHPSRPDPAACRDAVALTRTLAAAEAALLWQCVDGDLEACGQAGEADAETLRAVARAAVRIGRPLRWPTAPGSAGADDPSLDRVVTASSWPRGIVLPVQPEDGPIWGCLAVVSRDAGPWPEALLASLSQMTRQVARAVAGQADPAPRLARHLARAQRIAEVGSWENRIRENRLTWSEEIFRIFGVERGAFEATFDAFLHFVHPDDRPGMLSAHQRVLSGAMPLDFIHRITRPDGAVRVVRERGELFAEEGDVVLAGTVQDITEQVETEQQLRASEERFREMAETIEDVFWTWDVRDDRILYASASYETVFGQPRAELYRDARSFQRMIDPADLPRLVEAVSDDPYTVDVEYRIVRPDGERRWLDVRTFPVKSTDGTVLRVVGIGRDVTALKTAEQALLRAQRLESIGTLAGGIAHDLNNVLTPIVMASGLLATSPGVDAELVATINASAERGAAMVRQVLAFARGVEGDRIPLRLDGLLTDIARLVRDTFDRRIALDVHAAPGLWPVAGDATQLHQVLLNLAVNARDAMPNGGRLRLAARNVRLTQTRAASLPGASAGRYVVLEVSDTGTGIAPHLRDRVFDPFFTTKPQGQGTGLGLSTVQSLVRSHGGFLALTSEVDEGTTFTVYLPALDDASRTASARPALAVAPRGNGQRILVVDDEHAVRAVTRTTLEMFGYAVDTAIDGVSGVDAFARAPEAFAAVLTDMMMPNADGDALIAGVRRLRPEVPIIAASGVESPEMLERLAAAGVRHFLPKPYASDVLLTTLAQVLEDARDRGGPPPSAGG